MKKFIYSIIAALVVSTGLSVAPMQTVGQADAAVYRYIAVSSGNGNAQIGYATTRYGAIYSSLSGCSGCTVKLIFKDGCAAIVRGYGGYGLGVGSSRKLALMRARHSAGRIHFRTISRCTTLVPQSKR